MRLRIFVSLPLLLLAACQENMEAARRTTISSRDNVYQTRQRVKSYFVLPAYKEPQKQAADQRYCYRTYLDIVCYVHPQAGMEARLVASQGESPPLQASPEALAVVAAPPSVVLNSQQLQSERLAKARPVFVALPPSVKSDSIEADLSSISTSGKGHGPLF